MQTQRINEPRVLSHNSYLIPTENSGTTVFEINEKCFIGRDPENQVVVADPIVSRKHLKIEATPRGFILKDLDSANGTFVNNNKIKEIYLKEGDKIRLGSREFVFTLKDPGVENLHLTKSKNMEMQKVYKTIPSVAKTDLPVLILGESGTGKELVARLIHQESLRHNGPFVTINCSALGATMIESELFGHKKGSFTDAQADRKGAFEMARGGTLVLDEIGDLPLDLQPKLLRALENKEIRAIGSDTTTYTDVRVIASTHKGLKKMVEDGTFRADLYYRLNVIQVNIPTLRHRPEDIETLIYDFAREMRVAFSHSAIMKMKQHPWPGNIRELKNVVARASALFVGKRVEESDIDQLIEKIDSSEPKPLGEMPLLKEIEVEFIRARLKANRGNQRKTAIELGIPKSTLNDKIKKFKLNPEDFK
ncbi:MAG: sigma 54-interacting transcriptional regulator [Bdellovibrionales bacterium]|nr:sigma 54-interacting transcriptional regulator [Bdellovibrionales bacterium]